MSALDDFVFMFSSKGDKELNATIDTLKKAMQELRDTLGEVTKANEERKKSFKEKISVEKEKSADTLKWYKATQEQERKNKESEARIARANEKAEIDTLKRKREEVKLEKDLLNLKEKKRKLEQKASAENLKSETDIADKKSEIAEKNKLKEKQSAEQRKSEINFLKGLGFFKLLGAYEVGRMISTSLSDAFSRNFASTMTGGFYNLDAGKLKAFGSAIRQKGGDYESAIKSITSFQGLLSLLPISSEANEKLYTTLSLAGLLNESKGGITSAELASGDVFTIFGGISRALKNLDSKQRVTAKNLLRGLGLDEATLLFLEQENYAESMGFYGKGAFETPNTAKVVKGVSELKAITERISELSIEEFMGGIVDFFETIGSGIAKIPFWKTRLDEIYDQAEQDVIDGVEKLVKSTADWFKDCLDFAQKEWAKVYDFFEAAFVKLWNWLAESKVGRLMGMEALPETKDLSSTTNTLLNDTDGRGEILRNLMEVGAAADLQSVSTSISGDTTININNDVTNNITGNDTTAEITRATQSGITNGMANLAFNSNNLVVSGG